MTIEEIIEREAYSLVENWQQDLPEVQVVLGGSIVSGLLIVDEQTRAIDVDVRFLVEEPTSTSIQKKIEEVTGLTYRKTILTDDWPQGQSQAAMVEGTLQIPSITYPLDIEGCIRNEKYVGWHQYFERVFSEEELTSIRSQKRELRHDKVEYKKMKNDILAEVKRRCVELGLVSEK